MFTIQSAVTIVTAGLASHLFGFTPNLVVWSVIITIICILILVIGRYKLLDNLMKFIIITLTISTIIAVLVAFLIIDMNFPYNKYFLKTLLKFHF